jgi:hypothetical protein
MNRSSLLILIFAVLFAVFFIGPPLLSGECRLYTLMTTGDAIDVLTPLVLLPLYWLLFRRKNMEIKTAGFIAFAVLAALWAMGHGMHLSANSIKHLMGGLEGTDLYDLAYFYDEVLSHYLWHTGIAGLSALIIYEQWRWRPEEEGKLWVIILASVIYGFSFFAIVIEGGTAWLGIPFAVLAVIFGVIWGRKRPVRQPVLAFFLAGYVVAILLFAGWGIYYQDLPQFSEVGIL